MYCYIYFVKECFIGKYTSTDGQMGGGQGLGEGQIMVKEMPPG